MSDGRPLNVSMRESEQLLEGLELCQEMPLCSERVLKDLITLVKKHEKQNLPLPQGEVQDLLRDLAERLKLEGLMRAEVQAHIHNAEVALDKLDMEGFLK